MEYLDNLEIISQAEFEEYNNEKIPEYMINKIKSRGKIFFRQKAMLKSMEKVTEELNPNEEIIAYTTGRDIKAYTTKATIAYFGPKEAAIDLGDWGANVTVIKTNERVVLLSTNRYGQYLKHIFIDDPNAVQMFVTFKSTRIVVEIDKGTNMIIEMQRERLDRFIDALGEYSIKFNKKMYKTKGEKFLDYFAIGTLILALIYILQAMLMNREAFLPFL